MADADLTDKEVKKRSAPELTNRWWKTAWPDDKTPSSCNAMAAALKRYAEALRGTVPSDLVDALDAIEDAAARAMGDAKKIPFAKRKAAIVADLQAVERLVRDARADAERFGSATRVVFSYDLAARIDAEFRRKKTGATLQLRPGKVDVELLEAVVQELDARNALNSLYAEYSNALDVEVEKAAKELVDAAAKNSLEDVAQAVFDEHAKNVKDLFEKAPTNVLKKLGLNAALEAAYRKELNKRRLDIAKTAVLTVASGAAIALPGTQAFAIYGCLRSAAGLAQKLVEHNIKISTAADILQKQLAYLHKTFKAAAGRAVSETGGTTLNAVLGVDIMPTLDKAKSNYKDLKLNTSHAGFQVQKLTDEVMAGMDSAAELQKKLKSPDHADKRKELEKSLTSTEKALDKLLKKTHEVAKHLNSVEKRLPVIGKALKDLGDNSSAQVFANTAAKIVVSLTAIAGGGLVDATAATTAADGAIRGAEEIAAMTIASTGYANELYETVKGFSG